MILQDIHYMQLAIDLAKSVVNQTAPNPSVGAVLVKNGQIIGLGCHLFSGCPHAETYALNMHPELTAGSTLFVTLEPCSHFGKTPPCVNAIIAKGIKRVVIAILDPNPLVNGRGVQKLLDAGISVEVGLLEQEARELNIKYVYYIRNNMPYVTLKAGMSLDGKLATVANESKWITGPLSRDDAHIYRSNHDAILVGVNTVIADDPALTSHRGINGKNPIRIILDTNLRMPLDAQVITDKLTPTWIIVDKNVAEEKVAPFEARELVKVIKLDMTDLNNMLKELYILGITSVLVEGGSRVHTSFIEARLFNQLIMYMAPKLIGGENAPHFFAGTGFEKLADAMNLAIESVTTLGEDIKIIANKR